MTYDSPTGIFYFATWVSSYDIHICLIRSSNGVTIHCARFDSPSVNRPLCMKTYGNYLLVHGCSSSSLAKGNFVYWIRKDILSSSPAWCNVVTVFEANLVWTDDTFPQKSITLSDIAITDTTDYTPLPDVNTFAQPQYELFTVCELTAPPPLLNPLAERFVQGNSSFSISFPEFITSRCLSTASYKAVLSGATWMPSWAVIDSSSRTISGIFPPDITTATFEVTAHSTTGSTAKSTISV